MRTTSSVFALPHSLKVLMRLELHLLVNFGLSELNKVENVRTFCTYDDEMEVESNRPDRSGPNARFRESQGTQKTVESSDWELPLA